MFLILGDREDVLAAAVHRRLTAAGRRTAWLTETELAESTPFALRRDGGRVSGFLRCHGEDVPFDELSGVLVRLGRGWWPSHASADDRMFVYHETTAALFALLESLRCPVVNRFGLPWWLRDERYGERLAAGLRVALGVPAPRPADRLGAVRWSAYLAGPRLAAYAAMGDRDEAIDPDTVQRDGLGDWLDRSRDALADWQHRQGISFCRIELVASDGQSTITDLDAFPSLLDESPERLDRLAAATVELLS